jgi:cytochrome oxidase Cu insertion factor (SCO1/SenC/PrrC family)
VRVILDAMPVRLLPLLLAAALSCGAARAQAPEREANEAERLVRELNSGTVPVGAPFTLRDADGRRRSLADFRGKVVVLYFGFTFCPDVCPTDLAQIARALRSLGKRTREVQPLFVTLDPERDTPALLRRYVRSFHPSIVALTGSEAEVRRVARDFKVYSEKVPDGRGGYTIAHAAFTFVLGRDGRYREFVPPGTPSGRIAAVIEDALDESR